VYYGIAVVWIICLCAVGRLMYYRITCKIRNDGMEMEVVMETETLSYTSEKAVMFSNGY